MTRQLFQFCKGFLSVCAFDSASATFKLEVTCTCATALHTVRISFHALSLLHSTFTADTIRYVHRHQYSVLWQYISRCIIILVPLMLSHLLVHLLPLSLRSQIALFSMARFISGINFHFYFVNQFHLFMLTSIHPSLLHFPYPSPLHSFTLNSKLTFLVNLFPIDLLHLGLTSSANGTVFCFYCLYRC